MQKYMILRGRTKESEKVICFCNELEDAEAKLKEITGMTIYKNNGSYRIEKTSVYKAYLKEQGGSEDAQ